MGLDFLQFHQAVGENRVIHGRQNPQHGGDHADGRQIGKNLPPAGPEGQIQHVEGHVIPLAHDEGVAEGALAASEICLANLDERTAEAFSECRYRSKSGSADQQEGSCVPEEEKRWLIK